MEQVIALGQAVRPGHPMNEATTMGPSVSQRQLEQVLRYMEIGKGEAELRLEGLETAGDLAKGFFLSRPSLIASLPPHELPPKKRTRAQCDSRGLRGGGHLRGEWRDFGLTGSVFTCTFRAFQVVEELDTGDPCEQPHHRR